MLPFTKNALQKCNDLLILPVANQSTDNASHDGALNHLHMLAFNKYLLQTWLTSTNEAAPTTVVVRQIINKSLRTHLTVHCVFFLYVGIKCRHTHTSNYYRFFCTNNVIMMCAIARPNCLLCDGKGLVNPPY